MNVKVKINDLRDKIIKPIELPLVYKVGECYYLVVEDDIDNTAITIDLSELKIENINDIDDEMEKLTQSANEGNIEILSCEIDINVKK